VSSVGPFVDKLETMSAGYTGTRYAVATSTGTAALHIALLLAGVEAGDEVLVPTITFIAPVNAIRYVGAWPVFMDADPETWQMDARKTKDFLDKECVWKNGELRNKSTGRRVKAVLPVNILGACVDMDAIAEVSRRYELPIIEDGTESLGASYKNRKAGSLGDIGCLSFNGNKIITSGGGGMILANDEKTARKAKYLTTQAKDDPLEYIHHEIGYNYRLTNIQAAVGVAQFEQLDSFVAKKRSIAVIYDRALMAMKGVVVMPKPAEQNPTFWLYTFLLPAGTMLEQRKSALRRLNDMGIGSRPLWHPIHSLPPYKNCQNYRIEQADGLYARALSLPSSVGLTSEDQARCIEAVGQVVPG